MAEGLADKVLPGVPGTLTVKATSQIIKSVRGAEAVSGYGGLRHRHIAPEAGDVVMIHQEAFHLLFEMDRRCQEGALTNELRSATESVMMCNWAGVQGRGLAGRGTGANCRTCS